MQNFQAGKGKKQGKKVAFNNPSLDMNDNSADSKTKFSDPTEVVVHEEEEEEEEDKEENPSQQVKDDGHIMLVLKVGCKIYTSGKHKASVHFLIRC